MTRRPPVLARTADVLLRGTAAGLAGTAAMTVSSTVEARLRHREPSTTPARAAQKVLHIEQFPSEEAEGRFSTLVHWSYGTGWGIARAALAEVGLPPVAVAPTHFAAMWGGAAVMLPALDVTPPVTRWGRTEVAIDLFHHLVYATTTGLAYTLLAHRRGASAR